MKQKLKNRIFTITNTQNKKEEKNIILYRYT